MFVPMFTSAVPVLQLYEPGYDGYRRRRLPPVHHWPKVKPARETAFDKHVAARLASVVNHGRASAADEAQQNAFANPVSDAARPLDPAHAVHLINHSRAPDMRG